MYVLYVHKSKKKKKMENTFINESLHIYNPLCPISNNVTWRKELPRI